ncbi:MAG: hypothetical protein OXI63_16295 [Candidatus Poribacteria bacterium]|nr:hypothetical protein [Candidatus Poribacteria bacterium]
MCKVFGITLNILDDSHTAPLERKTLDITDAIDISLRWSGKQLKSD